MIRDEERGSSLIDDLYQAIQSEGGRVFALTAPSQNCGVAQCAAGLARRYADSGSNVLLVDFNLLQPKAHTEFDLEQLEWWPGDMASNEAIQEVSPHLSVLAAPDVGGAHISFRERMALEVALDEWQRRFDRVFLCCPPPLDEDPDQMPSDVLCSLTDGTILLVKGGRTTVPEVQAAVRQLERAGASVIGTVLNDASNPPVLFELYERLQRLEAYAPRLARLLRKLLSKSLILNAYR